MKACHVRAWMSWGVGAVVLLTGGLARAQQEGWQFPPDHQPPSGPNFVQAEPNLAQQTSGDQAQALSPEQLQQDQAPPPPDPSDGVSIPDAQIPDGDEQQLAPYGTWVNDPTYGWVWQPSEDAAGPDFTPYATNGDWTDTSDGWNFNSYYVWGAVPFHYGRWLWLPSGGWSWLPGTTWGPGWVAWRQGGGYVGWAPLGPRGYHWPARQSGGYPGSPWAFLDSGWFGRDGMMSHVIRGGAARGAYDASAPVQNMVSYGGSSWNAGPRFDDVVQGGGQVRNAASVRPAQVVAQPAVAQRPAQVVQARPVVSRPVFVRSGGGGGRR